MDMLNATDVRKNWSGTIDSVVRDKPAYVKRTHDDVLIIGIPTFNNILAGYRFYADRYIEEDGSVTLSGCDLDIVVNAENEDLAKRRFAENVKEYAEEFYSEYHLWANSANRVKHIPYVFKALTLDVDSVLEDIVCQNGKN